MYFHSRVKRGGLLDPKKQTVKELPAMTSVLSVGTCLLCYELTKIKSIRSGGITEDCSDPIFYFALAELAWM